MAVITYRDRNLQANELSFFVKMTISLSIKKSMAGVLLLGLSTWVMAETQEIENADDSLTTDGASLDDMDDFFVFDHEEESVTDIYDPLENYNRVIFSINDKIYRFVLIPVADTISIVPEPARNLFSNFYDNLGTPISGINALLQLDAHHAATEFSRFLINSTIGVFGIFDPASKMGLIRNHEDFGQTLAHYGIDHGFYMVLPILGPSSLRDGIGAVSDVSANPVLTDWNVDPADYQSLTALDEAVNVSFDKAEYVTLYDNSLDPYAFFRSVYTQYRGGLIE